MKKALLFLVLLFPFFTLCGCSAFGGTENNRSFTVAALGFDMREDKLQISAEIILINSENPETSIEPYVVTGAGNSIDEAFFNISRQLSRPLLLEHCGIIAIGEKVTAEEFNNICDYIFGNDSITLSAYLISAENCAELLSIGANSSVAAGYELMEAAELLSKKSKQLPDSRFFKILALRNRDDGEFSLPHFIKTEIGFSLDGVKYYKNDIIIGEADDE